MSGLHNYIKQLREDFTKAAFDESEADKNPFRQFELWLADALKAEIPEVQAMTLSTVSEDSKPSSRIVYLREFDSNRFWFYGNYQSRKGKELNNNPAASLNFFWPQLERQVRIEGNVSVCDPAYSDNYFNQRPRESQLGAWASIQSSELASRKTLEDEVRRFAGEFEGKNISRPPHWGGWVLEANYYEFWQGRKSRLHDRVVYVKDNDAWKITRLAP